MGMNGSSIGLGRCILCCVEEAGSALLGTVVAILALVVAADYGIVLAECARVMEGGDART
jgi:hypothetical protein